MDLWLVGSFILLAAVILFRERIALEWRAFKADWRKWAKRMWKEWGEPFLIAAVIAIFIRTFLVGPYKIPTGSMRTTLLEGDRIFVDKITYRFRPPQRGEIIVFKYPMDPKKDFVKRLIAFGGEEVEIRDGTIVVNGLQLKEPPQIANHYYYNRNDWTYSKEGQKIKIPPGTYFVLGDNSAQSSDSRYWGFVPKTYLIGRAFLIWWPLYRFGFVS